MQTLIGLAINLTNIDPIKALIYTAVINAIVAVPILITIMKMANDKKILEDRTNGLLSNIIGWITISIMGISILVMLFTWAQ